MLIRQNLDTYGPTIKSGQINEPWLSLRFVGSSEPLHLDGGFICMKWDTVIEGKAGN
jgi:hypothetical protein